MNTTSQLTAPDPDTPADDTEVVEPAIDPARIVDVDADEHDASTASAHDARTHHASAHDAGAYDAGTYDASTHDADSDIPDPEFDALVVYLEAVARRVVTEWREATAPPPAPPATEIPTTADASDAETGPAIAPEPEPETEPEPGTDEYDELHGIPWFELYR